MGDRWHRKKLGLQLQKVAKALELGILQEVCLCGDILDQNNQYDIDIAFNARLAGLARLKVQQQGTYSSEALARQWVLGKRVHIRLLPRHWKGSASTEHSIQDHGQSVSNPSSIDLC